MKTVTTLVLLPGLDGTELLLQPLIESLPRSIRAQVVCFPASGCNQYEYLLEVVSQAVGKLTDFYIVAWSFSGPLALMLAAAEPTRVNGVILLASFVRAPLGFLKPLRFAATAPVLWMVRAARRMPLWLGRRRADRLRRVKAELWRRVHAKTLAARLRAIIALDGHELLRRCRAPILYVAGSRDRVVPRRNLDEILQIKPSVRVSTIDGGHFAIYQNPRAMTAVIMKFIANQRALIAASESQIGQ